MKSLAIDDLARSEHLDRPTMSAVRGGWRVNAPGYAFGNLSHGGVDNASISAVQHLGQQQDVLTATANGPAFGGGAHADSKLPQRGDNGIVRP